MTFWFGGSLRFNVEVWERRLRLVVSERLGCNW